MLKSLPKKIMNVSDFQRNTKPTFEEIRKSVEPILVLNRNTPVGVFMSPDAYNEILDMYESMVDSQLLDEYMKFGNHKFVDVSKLDSLL